jgi:hypothetical protein
MIVFSLKWRKRCVSRLDSPVADVGGDNKALALREDRALRRGGTDEVDGCRASSSAAGLCVEIVVAGLAVLGITEQLERVLEEAREQVAVVVAVRVGRLQHNEGAATLDARDRDAGLRPLDAAAPRQGRDGAR